MEWCSIVGWCLRLGLEVKLQRAGRFRILGFRDLQACLGLGADSLFNLGPIGVGIGSL